MNARSAALAVAASIIVASCSEKPSPQPVANAEQKVEQTEKENGEKPREDEIAEDCVAFVRATKVVPARAPAADCPTCPAEGIEILAFRGMRIERISCAANTCEVAVALRAAFNPGPGGTIGGGLTAWISPEQRTEYLNGRVPSAEQIYRVKITYRRTGEEWRAIEFDKADPAQ
ncbi:MAG: hypothetical protein ACJ8M4_12490 [Chthoniobacterales bacterium]